MSDDKVVAAGKSKEEVAYELMKDLLFSCKDSLGHEHSRKDLLKTYLAARAVVYGQGSNINLAMKHLN